MSKLANLKLPMHPLAFSLFSDPFMLSADASGVVPVGVRPPPPLRGSSPCEAGQFWHPHGEQNSHYGRRMANKTAIMAAAWQTEEALRPRAEFIKSPLNFR